MTDLAELRKTIREVRKECRLRSGFAKELICKLQELDVVYCAMLSMDTEEQMAEYLESMGVLSKEADVLLLKIAEKRND